MVIKTSTDTLYESDSDFLSYEYVFSSPQKIVKNNCGWCWDVANLIMDYCLANQITYKSYFMEYNSNESHQTHTQVIINHDNMWYIAPDNSSDIIFGEKAYESADLCITDFVGSFMDFLKYRLKDKYEKDHLICKEFMCVIKENLSDDVYLNLIRSI